MIFKTFWLGMTRSEREGFASRCKTTVGHLSNIAYDCKPCSETLAIDIERESKAQVRIEQLSPKADWAYVRGTSRLKVSSVRTG